MKFLGIKTLIITAATGGLNKKYSGCSGMSVVYEATVAAQMKMGL